MTPDGRAWPAGALAAPAVPWTHDAAGDRLRARRHIVGQDAAKRAVAIALRNRWRRQQVPGAAGRDHAEEHPDDRAHRRRQDRDRAPPGAPGRRPVHQGRGDQVHRGRLRRPGRRLDHPRPRRERGQAEREAQMEGPRARRGRRRGARARRPGAAAAPRLRATPPGGRQHRAPGDAGKAPARGHAEREGRSRSNSPRPAGAGDRARRAWTRWPSS